MPETITQLQLADLESLDILMKANSNTLGFLPLEALKNFLLNGTVLGAKTKDDQLVGYLLYAFYPDRIRIVHLCVLSEFRGKGIAERLFDELKQIATTQKVIMLSCRRDFPATEMWPRLGFIPIDERVGRSNMGHRLTVWEYTLADDDQLDIFKIRTSYDALDVIIDAQIFFDLNEPPSAKSKPSHALLSDFLVDSLELWITDELLVEINRQENQKRRELSRRRAYTFNIVQHDQQMVVHYVKTFQSLLPTNTSAKESDIRHLAKAAASDMRIFVTRDERILKRAAQISSATNLRVISPTQLIVEWHEDVESKSYGMLPVSGQHLAWFRLSSTDLSDRTLEAFLALGERLGKFKEQLFSLLAHPHRFTCQLLRSDNRLVAIRVLEIRENAINVILARVIRSSEEVLLKRHLIADVIYTAVARDLSLVQFYKQSSGANWVSILLEAGFTETRDGYIRFCFAHRKRRMSVLKEIAYLSPESLSEYSNISNFDLERRCSPLTLIEQPASYFVLPIKPEYALSLFDLHLASEDLFGGKTSVLFRWDNVYYRKKTHYKMLKAPGRILWYESADIGEITAISHLDTVETGTPKKLYRKFSKFGILKWEDLYRMCDGDPMKEIMALRFSHTFSLRRNIPLQLFREIENKPHLTLQSPRKIKRQAFENIFETGFSGEI